MVLGLPRNATQPFDGGVLSCRADMMKSSGIPKDNKTKYMMQTDIHIYANEFCDYLTEDPKIKNRLKVLKPGGYFRQGWVREHGWSFYYQVNWTKEDKCNQSLF